MSIFANTSLDKSTCGASSDEIGSLSHRPKVALLTSANEIAHYECGILPVI